MDTHERDRHAFVMRVWRESAAEPWRGSVEDLGTGQRLSSGRLDDLTDFIVVRLDDGRPKT